MYRIHVILLAALMHAVVFGNVTAIIQRMYARRSNYHSKTRDLKDFFRARRVPDPLKTRMKEYFQTTWSINRGISLHDVMRDFPEEMQGEICVHLNRDILSLPLFVGASHGCKRVSG